MNAAEGIFAIASQRNFSFCRFKQQAVQNKGKARDNIQASVLITTTTRTRMKPAAPIEITQLTAPSRHPYLNWIWRELRISIPAQVLSAWFLSALFSRPFWILLAEVACVGCTIHVFIEAGRYGMSWYLRRALPQHPSARYGWPGWVWMAPWSIVSCVFGFYFGTLLSNQVLGYHKRPEAILQHPLELLIVTTVIFTATTACICFIYIKGRMALMEMQTAIALRSATEHRLKLLESQLEPHMLFNTLANLRVLIGIDAQQAQHMLDKLSDFLRASLSASRASNHSLLNEFARLEDYLALMKIRMGDRLSYQLHLPPELAAREIPCLLLQPLVENAIKHGVDPLGDAATIEVSAQRVGEQLHLLVYDTGVGFDDAELANKLSTQDASTASTHHFGLQQVRERLEAMYGDHAQLQITGQTLSQHGQHGTRALITLAWDASAPTKENNL